MSNSVTYLDLILSIFDWRVFVERLNLQAQYLSTILGAIVNTIIIGGTLYDHLIRKRVIHFDTEWDIHTSSENYEEKWPQPWFGLASHLVLPNRVFISFLPTRASRFVSQKEKPPRVEPRHASSFWKLAESHWDMKEEINTFSCPVCCPLLGSTISLVVWATPWIRSDSKLIFKLLMRETRHLVNKLRPSLE